MVEFSGLNEKQMQWINCLTNIKIAFNVIGMSVADVDLQINDDDDGDDDDDDDVQCSTRHGEW